MFPSNSGSNRALEDCAIMIIDMFLFLISRNMICLFSERKICQLAENTLLKVWLPSPKQNAKKLKDECILGNWRRAKWVGQDELATKQFCKIYHQLKASVFRLWALFGNILSTFFKGGWSLGRAERVGGS